VYAFAILFFTAASVVAVWMLCVAWREARRRGRRGAMRGAPPEFTPAEVRSAFEKFVAGRKAGGGAVRMSGLSVLLFAAVLAGGAPARAQQDQSQERRAEAAEARGQESRERREAERRQRDEAQRQPGVRCQRYHRRGKS